jgi:hypothetical protein
MKYEINISQTKSITSFAQILLICCYMALVVGLPDSALVDEPGVFLDDVTPPWFSLLICHLWDEQYTRWWPQF